MAERATCIATISLAIIMLLVTLWVGITRPMPQHDLAASEPVNYRIDPNAADVDELSLLPRIGPGIARRIVDDRQTHGRFDSATEMQRVPFIGEKTSAAIEPWITFEPVMP